MEAKQEYNSRPGKFRGPVLLMMLLGGVLIFSGCSEDDSVNSHISGNACSVNVAFNGQAESGDMTDWTILANGGNGWLAAPGTFKTSYVWDQKSQEIDLLTKGLTLGLMGNGPNITVSEYFYRNDGIGSGFSILYYLYVELRDAAHVPLAIFDTGVLTSTNPVPAVPANEFVTHTFSGYNVPGNPVQYVYWEDGGTEDRFWAGHYGAYLNGAKLQVGDCS